MSGVSATRQEAVAELRGTVRRFVTDRDAVGQARRMLDGGAYDDATWSTMARQLGLAGLTLPEELGGAAAGWPEAVGVLEELGAALLPSAYFGTSVLAATAIALSRDDAAQTLLLPPLAGGERTATLAVLEQSGSWDPRQFTLTASQHGETHRLDGTKLYVVDGHLADLVVVVARSEEGLSLYAVEGDSPGLTRTPLPTLDPTRPLARLEFQAVAAMPVGAPGQAQHMVEATLDRAALAVAAESLGGADRCLQLTLRQAKERVAFGRPIGGFQAVKHKLADLYLELEFARAAVEAAAAAADEDADLFPVYASVAMAQAVDTFALVATETIHLHGGTGFTWEHDAQLYFRRAKSSQLLFGDPSFHRERIAGRLLDSDVPW
jgi:alkylation response protein AidB-like acyl-CoA dehydrogenase